MKAIVFEKYGPPEVLQLKDIDKPMPKDDEVMVRVQATTVTIGDTRMRSFTVPPAMWLPSRIYLGIFGPRRKILGMELAGDIVAVGATVTRFRVGDAVFASTFEANFGGYAEYKCFPETAVLALKPANLTYGEAAAAVGAGMTALRCLSKANIQPGQKVLIYGASGAVGTNAVQIVSRHIGAQVTGVCSTANLDLVRSLGAEKVIDYTREDFTQSGETYDVVFDAVAKFPPARARLALKPGGVYLNVHKDSDSASHGTPVEELLALKALLESGTVRPVIDRCYPMDQIVEAHHYVDAGHKKGSVVIMVGQEA
ncbi:MAG: NAD(P)-dependent alcohol dehydrogenase [Chloroflexi bacterium]|nr:NAD(P)-dependent alcohol dehydrogenase [Chloroflexota bacterium]